MRLIEFFERFSQGEEVFLRFTRVVGDVMTERPISLTEDQTLADAIDVFETRSIRHLPIVRSDTSELVGLVSHRDVSRAVPPGLGTTVEIDESTAPMLGTALEEIMTRNVLRVTPLTPVSDAIQILLDRGVDCLPVVRDGGDELVGIVTTLDFVKGFQCLTFLRRLRQEFLGVETKHLPLQSFVNSTAHQVMSPADPTATDQQTLEDVLRLMNESRSRRVWVVDPRSQALRGVVSDRDVLHYLPPIPRGERGELFRLTDDPETRSALQDKVFSLMTQSPFAVAPMTPMTQVVDLFCDRKFGAVPVVAGERLVGAITQEDLLLEFINAYRAEADGEPSSRFPIRDA